jgi:hypothetical protein
MDRKEQGSFTAFSHSLDPMLPFVILILQRLFSNSSRRSARRVTEEKSAFADLEWPL